eukprot:1343561-Rhodomonas_salina.1
MIYHQGIWRLPVLTKETASALHHHTYVTSIRAEGSWISAENPYRLGTLLELANEVEPVRASTNPVDMEKVTKITEKIMQLLHDKWGHPSNSKMEGIVLYYKSRGFPP